MRRIQGRRGYHHNEKHQREPKDNDGADMARANLGVQHQDADGEQQPEERISYGTKLAVAEHAQRLRGKLAAGGVLRPKEQSEKCDAQEFHDASPRRRDFRSLEASYHRKMSECKSRQGRKPRPLFTWF